MPEPATVERHWILRLYTWLHGSDYDAWRVELPGLDGEPSRAHLLVPPGEGPHAAVLVLPILAGSHVVSEGLAKALVGRGYAVLRLERRPLFADDEEPGLEEVARRLRTGLVEARRALDWLSTHPEVDASRLAVAGVSLGGIMAATLAGMDPRLRAGFFVAAGGGIPEILWESRERPLRALRERIRRDADAAERERFLERVRAVTDDVDPLRYAGSVDPRHVVLVSARYDRIVPPARTRVLWEAMGGPRWHVFPAGHYSMAPFFWWSVHRGADLLDEVLRR